MNDSFVIGFNVSCATPGGPGLDCYQPVFVVLSLKWEGMESIFYQLVHLEAKSTGRELGEDTPEMAEKIAQGLRDSFAHGHLPAERRQSIRVEHDGAGPGMTLGRIVVRGAQHVDIGSYGDVGKIVWELIAMNPPRGPKDKEGPATNSGEAGGVVCGIGCKRLSPEEFLKIPEKRVKIELPRVGHPAPTPPPMGPVPKPPTPSPWNSARTVRDASGGQSDGVEWRKFIQNRPWGPAGNIRLELDSPILVARGVSRGAISLPFPIASESPELQVLLIQGVLISAGVEAVGFDGLVFPMNIRGSGAMVTACGIYVPPNTHFPWSMVAEARLEGEVDKRRRTPQNDMHRTPQNDMHRMGPSERQLMGGLALDSMRTEA